MTVVVWFKSFTGAVVMSLTYGYDVKESGDHYVAIAEELLTLASESLLPGALLVNDFPICSCPLIAVICFLTPSPLSETCA